MTSLVKRAALAPSVARWSNERDSGSTSALVISSTRTAGVHRDRPIPRMATYGQFAYTHPTTKAFRLTGTGSSLIFAQPVLQPWKSKLIGDFGSGNRGPQPRMGATPTTSNVPLLGYVAK